MSHLILLALSTLLAPSAQDAPPQSAAMKVRKIAVGGEGGWDYLTVDPPRDRLYISRGTHVMVVDPGNGKVVGDIPNTNGVHGIAVANDLGKGFTSDGTDNDVTVLFGQDPQEANSLADGYRRFHAKNVGVEDILRTNKNAVMLWKLHPTDADESDLTDCLK